LNIIYLSEINPYKWNGGGQTIERGIIDKALSRGHKIINLTPSDDEQMIVRSIFESDLVFCCDMDNRPTVMKWFSPNIFNIIMQKRNYVTFSNGYCDVCRKDYTPCNLTGKLNCINCPAKDELRRQFFYNSKFSIFLSSLQAEASLNLLNIHKPYLVCTPDADLSMFKNNNLERDIDLLYLGVICEAKGYYNIIEYIENNNLTGKNIVWVGDNLIGNIKYGKHIAKIEHNEVPYIMNRARYFIQLPRWKEAFSLSAIEASLCGCELIYNENVGALHPSEEFYVNKENPHSKLISMEDLKNPDRYSGNYDNLWSTLEKHLS